MRPLDSSREILARLVTQLRESGSDATGQELTDLVHVVGDVGRSLAEPQEDDVRALLPYIGSLREEFERQEYAGAIETTPWQALSASKHAIAYAAGAMWASAAIVEGLLSRRAVLEDRANERVSRHQVRETVLALLSKEGIIRPGDVRDYFAGQDMSIDRTVVSKAIGDLLQDGQVEVVEGEAPDRRHRYYRLATSSEGPPPRVLDEIRTVVRHSLAHTSADHARELFAEAVERETVDA